MGIMFRNGINHKKWDECSGMELMYSFYEKGRTQYFQAMKVEGRNTVRNKSTNGKKLNRKLLRKVPQL